MAAVDYRGSQRKRGRSLARLMSAAVVALLMVGLVPDAGHATVTVSRAELKGTTLRLEGRALANRQITVDSVVMGRSDGSGRFRIERSGYTRPADCTVDVNDGSASATTARLTGCTVTTTTTTATTTTTTSAPTTTTTAAPTTTTTTSAPTTTTTTAAPSPGPRVTGVTLSDTDVVGGTSVTGSVQLESTAPTGGTVVPLESNNTTAATVPPSVTVPAGSRSGSFTVTTHPVTNSQSSTIIATSSDGARFGSTITVRTERDASFGSVSLTRGGTGEGRVTSSPPGIDCTFFTNSTSGTCSNAFFAAGTEVTLTAQPASNSRFLGWEFEVSCPNAPEVTVQAGVAHICRPAFALR